MLFRSENMYLKTLRFALRGRNPWYFFTGTFGLLIVTIIFYSLRDINVNFFPVNEPNYINIEAELPLGTDIRVTDEFMREFEKDIEKILEPNVSIIKSVLTTVGIGMSSDFAPGGSPYKALSTISFVDFNMRGGVKTSDIQRELTERLINSYPGVKLSFEKDDMGPPAGDRKSVV